jgi:hypothetical protein
MVSAGRDTAGSAKPPSLAAPPRVHDNSVIVRDWSGTGIRGQGAIRILFARVTKGTGVPPSVHSFAKTVKRSFTCLVRYSEWTA